MHGIFFLWQGAPTSHVPRAQPPPGHGVALAQLWRETRDRRSRVRNMVACRLRPGHARCGASPLRIGGRLLRYFFRRARHGGPHTHTGGMLRYARARRECLPTPRPHITVLCCTVASSAFRGGVPRLAPSDEPLRYGRVLGLKVFRPARERRSAKEDVVRGPLDTAVVHGSRRLVVLAYDVEGRARSDGGEELVNDLIRLPRAALPPLLRRVGAVLDAVVLALVFCAVGLEGLALDSAVASRADHCVDAAGD